MNNYFLMPDFFYDRKINITLLKYIKKFPEILNKDVSVESFYGSFPGMIWNGGRLIDNTKINLGYIKNIIDIYNEYDIPLTFTLTNPAIKDSSYCDDEYCNAIIEAGHNGKNRILVSSSVLEDYLRKYYPKYKYCRSVINTNSTIKFDDYYLIVLDKIYNKDFTYLDHFSSAEKEKIELICNDNCIDNCPYRQTHYLKMGEATLSIPVNKDDLQCKYKSDEIFWLKELKERTEQISYDDIINLYSLINIHHFKLCGRESDNRRIMNWLNYIFDPQYKDDILDIILNQARKS